jgi:hypothetical protein
MNAERTSSSMRREIDLGMRCERLSLECTAQVKEITRLGRRIYPRSLLKDSAPGASGDKSSFPTLESPRDRRCSGLFRNRIVQTPPKVTVLMR